ncbi:MAG: hypothetical protein KKE17_08790 [Proteobacteria bacterium]|nr:hypothetical protein [Pseudomonadota bacterium]MBU1710084.1 hypothetical protein [Pseudomonadota bacterium]
MDPVKFIILGNARTGSNLLVDQLKACPEVRVLGELFNLNSLKKVLQIRFLDNPLQYLEDQLALAANDSIKTIGFKIFYYHATTGQLLPGNYPDKNIEYAPPHLKKRINRLHDLLREKYNLEELGPKIQGVWAYLKNDPELKVIHLKRKNKLATFLSLRRAFMTDEWTKPKGVKARAIKAIKDIPRKISGAGEINSGKSSREPVYLSYEDCLEAFERSTAWEQEYDEFFKDHAKTDILYENIKSDPRVEMEKIYSLLGLEGEVELSDSLAKQNRKPLSESIANYQELKNRFAQTPWQEFFID